MDKKKMKRREKRADIIASLAKGAKKKSLKHKVLNKVSKAVTGRPLKEGYNPGMTEINLQDFSRAADKSTELGKRIHEAATMQKKKKKKIQRWGDPTARLGTSAMAEIASQSKKKRKRK